MRKPLFLFSSPILVLALGHELAAGELKGRLLLADKPAPGVTISAVPHESPFDEGKRQARGGKPHAAIATAVSKPDGAFVLVVPKEPGKPETTFAVELSGAGIVPVRLEELYATSESEDLGERTVVKGEDLAGRVVDARGEPVADAEVTLTSARDVPGRMPVATKTGADGSFRLTGVSRAAVVTASHAGFAPASVAEVKPGVLSRPLVLSPGVTLTGVVRTPGGKGPAAGALVRFEGDAATRWVETGENGAFEIRDAPRGKGTLVADAGETGSRELAVLAPSTKPLELVLAAPAVLEGRVVDAKGSRPVPRVRISLTSPGGARVVRSGPDGRYRLRPLTKGTFALRADEPSYVPFVLRDVTLAAGEQKKLDLPLTLGATLAGRVVDENGAGIATARGELSRGGARGIAAILREARGEEAAAFRTNADGTFRAARLAPGENQRLQVRHPDHERAVVGGISLAPGAVRANVTVVMRRGATVAGRIVDASGAPVAGADVDISAPMGGRRGRGGAFQMIAGGGNRRTEKSGADGRFEIKGVLAGDHALTIAKLGYATEHVDVVKVVEGTAPEPLLVTLSAGAAIRGFVKHKDGTGAEGFIVLPGFARGLRGDGGRGPEPTGPDGAFALEGLKQGEAYDVSVVSATGLGPQKRISAPADGVELVVTGTGRIAGRALDGESGRPLADFFVSYEPEAGGPGMGRMIRVASRAIGRGTGLGERVEVHAEDGAFLIEDVPAGTWRVVFEAKGYQAARVGSVVVEEGATKEGVEAKLAKGARIAGRVTDARNGRPVPGAAITSAAAGGERGFRMPGFGDDGGTSTDADGRFELEDLAPGKYQVTARHGDYSDATETVEVGDRAAATVELKLSAGGDVGGVVLSETRQGASGVDVSLEPAGDGGFGRRMFGGGESAITDPSGRFRFDHVSPGRYTVSASYRGKSSTPVEVVLQAGDSREDLALTLQTGTAIRGVVSGLPESLKSGVAVNASGPDSFFASSRTGADGRFEVTGAPAGAITLRANAGDITRSRTAVKQVNVSGEEPFVETEIVFEDGLRLSGSVTRRGEAVSGASVYAGQQGGGGRSASAQTDERGGYVLDGLHEGTYTVTASLSMIGGGSKRETVTLAGDQTLDLAIPAARVSGTVVEAGSRAPLADAAVEADSGDGAGGFFRALTTDSNGRFTLSDLEDKSYTLTFRRPGFQYEKRTVAASERGSDDLVVELSRGEGIGIEVRDGIYGVPLHGVLARVVDAQKANVFTGAVSLDSEGRGEIPSLRPGRYSVTLDASGYAPIALDVNVPQPTLRVTMTPGGTLEIHAGPETLAKGSATCQLLTASGAPYPLSLFSGEGWVTLVAPVRRLENLAPGGYLLAGRAAPRPFTIAEGKVTVLELP